MFFKEKVNSYNQDEFLNLFKTKKELAQNITHLRNQVVDAIMQNIQKQDITNEEYKNLYENSKQELTDEYCNEFLKKLMDETQELSELLILANFFNEKIHPEYKNFIKAAERRFETNKKTIQKVTDALK